MKKKTKLIILSVVLILLAVLLIPFKVDILEDGGSKVYSAVLYKYVKWVGFQKSEQTGVYETETIKKSVYWFPENFKHIDELRRKAFSQTKQNDEKRSFTTPTEGALITAEIRGENIVVEPSPTITPTEWLKPAQLSREEILAMSTIEVAEYIRKAALCNDLVKLDVKTYDSAVWLEKILGQKRMVGIGKDFSVYENYGNGTTLVRSLLYSFPEIQPRKMPDGMYYTAFASENGERVFWFTSEENNLFALVGYPVLICPGQLKKHEDFSEITEGCTLDDVLRIDPVIQYYFDMFYRNGTPTEDSLWVSKTALRYNTVHYLSDGILEFGYGEINENGELVVTGIRYSPDYTLEDCRGRKIVYQINPMDLP